MRLFAALLFAATVCSAADYPVGGIVINAQTGAALPDAEVYLFRPGAAQPVANMTTGEDGRFNLDVPEGTYRMLAGTRVHPQNYGSKYPDEGFGSAVIVGPTHNTTNLTFRWFPTAAIFGRVADDAGEPVENALVQLVRSSVIGGHRLTRSAGFTRTNDRGEYRFGSIPGGARYYLAVSGRPWYSAGNQFVQADPAQPAVAFVPLFYPSTPDPSRAAPLIPKPGEELRADFALASTVGATVTVKHNLPAGKGAVVNLISPGVAGNNSFFDPVQIPNFGGQFPPDPKFNDVPPGHYTVQIVAAGGESYMEGSAAVDVNGSNVTAEVSVQASATLSGTVRFANPASAPRAAVIVGLADEAGAVGYNAPVRADGSFEIPRVLAGKYRPVVRNTGSYAVQVEVSGAPFRNGFVELSPGDSPTVKITASADVGEVKGFVMNGDRPLDAVLAVLASATESEGALRYQGYQTESDGSFDFKYIPPGQYFLFAVDDTALEFANPAVVKPYFANAKAITVEAHGSSTERLPLTSPITK